MKKLNIGDIIQDINGDKAKILEVGVSGETFLKSCRNKFAYAADWYTLTEIEEKCWKKVEGNWYIRKGERYWFIWSGGVYEGSWVNDKIDNDRKNGLGIYPTEEEAQEAFEKAEKAVRE